MYSLSECSDGYIFKLVILLLTGYRREVCKAGKLVHPFQRTLQFKSKSGWELSVPHSVRICSTVLSDTPLVYWAILLRRILKLSIIRRENEK